MELRPGLRLRSAVGPVEIVIVRADAAEGMILECQGVPMLELNDAAEPADTPGSDDVRLGKRYEQVSHGLEVLCTKGGPGPLGLAGESLTEKGAKPLPASD